MWKQFEVKRQPPLSRNPILLIALSTVNPQFVVLYSQARELANYLLENLEFKKFATFYSSSLPAAISISKDGISDLVGVSFYETRSNSRDVVLVAGYGSPTSNEYEFSAEILEFARGIGVKEVISIGARWNEEPLPPLEKPKIMGFSTDDLGTRWLEENGVTLLKGEPAYYFANTIIGMAAEFGLRGSKLSVNHGEPKPHPRSLISILEVLKRKLDLSLDTSKLETKAQELSKLMRSSGYQSNDIARDNTIDKGKEDIYR